MKTSEANNVFGRISGAFHIYEDDSMHRVWNVYWHSHRWHMLLLFWRLLESARLAKYHLTQGRPSVYTGEFFRRSPAPSTTGATAIFKGAHILTRADQLTSTRLSHSIKEFATQGHGGAELYPFVHPLSNFALLV